MAGDHNSDRAARIQGAAAGRLFKNDACLLVSHFFFRDGDFQIGGAAEVLVGLCQPWCKGCLIVLADKALNRNSTG